MAAAFVIGLATVFKTVAIKRPGREEEEFTAEIRVRDLDEQDALHQKQQSGEAKGFDHVKEDVVSLDGFADKNGKPMEVTDEMKEKLLKDPYVLMGCVRAWNQVQQGMPELTAKN